MKCSQCGREFSADELEKSTEVCPECGHPINEDAQEAQNAMNPEQNEEENSEQREETSQPDHQQPGTSSSKKKMWLIAAVVALAVASAAFFLMKPKTSSVSSKEHENPTALAYITEDAVSLAKGDKSIALYKNEADGGTAKEQVSQLLASGVPYIGDRNYLELANKDVVYIPLGITSPQNMVGKLCLKTASGEEKVLDEEASMIYCHGDNSVYYNKLVDEKLQQVRYLNGELTPISEIAGQEDIIVVKASKDDSLLQVLQLDDKQNTVAGGYIYNGKLHLLDSKYTIFNISPNGKEVFVVEANDKTQTISLYRIKDLETEEMELLGNGMSEAIMYDNGTLIFLADCNIEANPYNPVGSIYMYKPGSEGAEKVADNAVALLESQIRKNGWMNENGRDLSTSEQARDFERDKPLFEGQVHYIDAQGNLCASSTQTATVGESGLQGFTICENFYDVNNYSFADDVIFATGTRDYLYWSRGAELFRYRLGSMQAPEVIPLNESVEEKVEENNAQVGYITSGSGNIIEETQEKLVLKNFDDENSVTILENVGRLKLAGLNNDGTEIYFISEDGSLYSKSVTSKSNPKRIDSNVVQAQATSEGLYYVVGVEKEAEPTVGESKEEADQPVQKEYQYNLMFVEYGQKKGKMVAQNVHTIVPIHVEQ